jgi:hypothetical protein
VGCNDDARDESVKVNSQARFGKQAKWPVHTTLHSLPTVRWPLSLVFTIAFESHGRSDYDDLRRMIVLEHARYWLLVRHIKSNHIRTPPALTIGTRIRQLLSRLEAKIAQLPAR